MRSERGALNHYKKRKPAYSNKDSGQSVQFSSVVSDFLHLHGLQHIRPPCPSPTPRACSNLMSMELVMPSNHLILCHPLLLLPSIFWASGSFLMSQFFESVAKALELQLQHQSFQWIFRTDFLQNWVVGSPCSPRDSQVSSLTQFKSINSSAVSFLYSPTLTSIRDYWKKRIFDQMDLCWQSNVSAF